MMYWINSGYNCRVSDRGAHFFGRRPVLCNNDCYSKFLYPRTVILRKYNFIFAKVSWTPCLFFARPILANNTSYQDSFTTCQITPENHGLFLGSLSNMQLTSRNPFSGQFFFAKFTGPPPSIYTLIFARSFAELSRKYPYSQTPAISRGCTKGKAKTRGLGVWLSQSLTFGNLATATRILWCPSPAGPRAAVGGSPLMPFT